MSHRRKRRSTCSSGISSGERNDRRGEWPTLCGTQRVGFCSPTLNYLLYGKSKAADADNFILASRGRDVFKSPQGCSRTHPVGKDNTYLAPRSCSRTHPVGKDNTYLAPRSCSRTHSVGKDNTYLAPRSCSRTHSVGKDNTYLAPRSCSRTHSVGKDNTYLAPRSCSRTHSVGKDNTYLAPRSCSRTHSVGKDNTYLAPRSFSRTHSVGKDDKKHPVDKDKFKVVPTKAMTGRFGEHGYERRRTESEQKRKEEADPSRFGAQDDVKFKSESRANSTASSPTLNESGYPSAMLVASPRG